MRACSAAVTVIGSLLASSPLHSSRKIVYLHLPTLLPLRNNRHHWTYILPGLGGSYSESLFWDNFGGRFKRFFPCRTPLKTACSNLRPFYLRSSFGSVSREWGSSAHRFQLAIAFPPLSFLCSNFGLNRRCCPHPLRRSVGVQRKAKRPLLLYRLFGLLHIEEQLENGWDNWYEHQNQKKSLSSSIWPILSCVRRPWWILRINQRIELDKLRPKEIKMEKHWTPRQIQP